MLFILAFCMLFVVGLAASIADAVGVVVFEVLIAVFYVFALAFARV